MTLRQIFKLIYRASSGPIIDRWQYVAVLIACLSILRGGTFATKSVLSTTKISELSTSNIMVAALGFCLLGLFILLVVNRRGIVLELHPWATVLISMASFLGSTACLFLYPDHFAVGALLFAIPHIPLVIGRHEG